MSVTVVLTTKGRHLHTLRWLWHHDRIRLPFDVIVADGEVVEPVARLLADPSSFPNLRLRYLRYHDTCRQDYWRKLTDATRQVTTPYVIMADNDDFVLPALVGEAARFLDGAPEYVAAGGAVANFALWTPKSLKAFDQVSGQVYSGSIDTMAGFPEPTIEGRLAHYFERHCFMFYFITRTPALLDIYEGVDRLGVSNFDTWEHFMYLSRVLRGKSVVLPGVGYYRQTGTSQTHAAGTGWIYRLFFEDWMKDWERMSRQVAADAERLEGVDPEAVMSLLRRGFCDKLSAIRSGAAPVAPPSAFRRLLREIAPLRAVQRRRILARIERHLSALGADSAALTSQRNEFAAVHQSLASAEFRRFVAEKAPELLPQ